MAPDGDPAAADAGPAAPDAQRPPPPVVLVVGTGTDVGKTWVAALVLRQLRRGGVSVAARKTAQSYDPSELPGSHDADVLAAASGEDPDVVCLPRRHYPVAMAPPMAAEVLGRPAFTVADLVGELHWPAGAAPAAAGPGAAAGARVGAAPAALGLVETAGGVCSPQAADGDTVDLARLLAPALVVLVADAGLGTIHAVRSSAPRFGEIAPPPPVVVVLNRFDAGDDLHRRNGDWLAERDGFAVVTLPGQEALLADRVRAVLQRRR